MTAILERGSVCDLIGLHFQMKPKGVVALFGLVRE